MPFKCCRAQDEVEASAIINSFRSCDFVFSEITINSSNKGQDGNIHWDPFSSIVDVNGINFGDYY